MDTVLVNDKPFLGVGGYGFDALIAKRFDEGNVRGFSSYIKLVLREYLRFSPAKINFNLEGEDREEVVVLCTIANSSEFGNGFKISPKSSVEDGKLELCLLRPFSLWAAPAIAYRFFKGTADKSRFTEIIPFSKGRIFLDENIAHYDGEPFAVRNELNIEVVPKSLYILVGKNN